MQRVVGGILVITVSLCCAGCASEPFSEAGLKVDSPNSRIIVVDEESLPVLLIESPQGIGSCVVTLMSGEWPAKLTARFAYGEDRPFSMMEAVSVSNDEIVVATRLGVTAPSEVSGKARSAGSPKVYTSDFEVTSTADGIEVVVPLALLRSEKSFQLEWTDALRR